VIKSNGSQVQNPPRKEMPRPIGWGIPTFKDKGL